MGNGKKVAARSPTIQKMRKPDEPTTDELAMKERRGRRRQPEPTAVELADAARGKQKETPSAEALAAAAQWTAFEKWNANVDSRPTWERTAVAIERIARKRLGPIYYLPAERRHPDVESEAEQLEALEQTYSVNLKDYEDEEARYLLSELAAFFRGRRVLAPANRENLSAEEARLSKIAGFLRNDPSWADCAQGAVERVASSPLRLAADSPRLFLFSLWKNHDLAGLSLALEGHERNAGRPADSPRYRVNEGLHQWLEREPSAEELGLACILCGQATQLSPTTAGISRKPMEVLSREIKTARQVLRGPRPAKTKNPTTI